jgi:hypothetical protein
MSDRKDWFFQQVVTEGELDNAFDDLEDADRDLVKDLGLAALDSDSDHGGIMDGLAVSVASGVAVDVTQGVGYDDQGRRVGTNGALAVDISQTGSTGVGGGGTPTGGSSTAPGGGNKRWVSVFIVFDRDPQDPRIDGTGTNIDFEQVESFRFDVTQGAPAVTPTDFPPLQTGKLLLGDFRVTDATTVDLIQVDRRQIWLRARDSGSVPVTRAASGIPVRGLFLEDGVRAGLEQIIGYYNDHTRIDGSAADKHRGDDITVAVTATWADTTGITATDITGALDEILNDLSATGASADGAGRLGAEAVAGSPNSLSAGKIGSQIATLLAELNNHENAAASAHAATAINATGTNQWANSEALVYTEVDAALEELVGDLAETVSPSGAARVGALAQTGAGLNNTTGAITLSAGGIAAQLLELLDGANGRVQRGGDTMAGDLLPSGVIGIGNGGSRWNLFARSLDLSQPATTTIAGVIQALTQASASLLNVKGRTNAIASAFMPPGGMVRKHDHLRDDFMGSAIDSSLWTGTGTTGTIFNGGGRARITSSAAVPGTASIETGTLFDPGGLNMHLFGVLTIQDLLSEQEVVFGFGDVSPPSARGIFFFMDGTNWIGRVIHTGGTQDTGTVLAADNAIHRFEILVDASNNEVHFIIDETNIQTLVASGGTLITGSDYAVMLNLDNTVGNAHDVDLFSIQVYTDGY